MSRLFIALPLPQAFLSAIEVIQQAAFPARWQNAAQLHLTLAFIGDVDTRATADIADSLNDVAAPPLSIRLAGVGHFGDKRRVHSLWVGVDPADQVSDLAIRVTSALRRSGHPPETRRYVPHVTVARLSAMAVTVSPWLAVHGEFATNKATISRFGLYESTLGHGGAHYTLLADYPLDARY